MARAAGASVILWNGRLAAFFRRHNSAVRVFLPEDEPERSQIARDVAQAFAEVATRRQILRRGLLIQRVNDTTANEDFMSRFFEESGFAWTSGGFQIRRYATPATTRPVAESPEANVDETVDTADSDTDIDPDEELLNEPR
jgi:ATP-dependent Lhr-like helicase